MITSNGADEANTTCYNRKSISHLGDKDTSGKVMGMWKLAADALADLATKKGAFDAKIDHASGWADYEVK